MKFISKTFNLTIRGVEIEPTYWQAVVIVFLLFLLVFTFARVRYLYVHWSLGKSSIAMFFWGFLLAIIAEGFFIVGGRTIFTEILGWDNAPKPISTALSLSREKLVDVLGVTEEIPQSSAQAMQSYQSVVGNFLELSEDERKVVKEFICEQ